MPVRTTRGRHRRKGRFPHYVYKLRALVARKKFQETGVADLKMIRDVQKWIEKRKFKPHNSVDWEEVEAGMTEFYKARKSDKRVVRWVTEPNKEDKADLLDVLDAIEKQPVEGYTLLPEEKALTNPTVVPIAFLRSGKCLCAYKA